MQQRIDTAYRMQQQQANRMNTAQRVPTRMNTALRNDPNYVSVANTTNLKFVERPVTMHGVEGLRPTTTGPGRQIQDKQKQQEIYDEIEKYKKQQETFQKDNLLYVQLEKRHEELTKEVRELEGQLADYNLAFDKFRANTRPDDIKNIFERIKIQNERQKSQLDEIFIERKKQEDDISLIEQRLTELQQLADMKLNELDPEQRNEYLNLINENKSLQNDIINQKNELEDLNMRMQNADSRLRMDAQKLKGQMLKEQIQEMEQKKNDLEVQLNEANLSFPEARDRLLNKVKDDNVFIQNTEKKVRDIRRTIENYEKRLRELQNELEDKSQEQDRQKYEILYQRDQEMTDYIQNFEKIRQPELEMMDQIQNNIVELLNQSSKIALNIKSIPQLTDYQEMVDEMNVKMKGGDTEKSAKMLQMQCEETQQKLRNLDIIEDRLKAQIQQMKQKTNQMRNEVDEKFDKIDQMKMKESGKKDVLYRQKLELEKLKQDYTNQLKDCEYKYQVEEQKYIRHEQYQQLTDLEKKVSQLESQANTFQIFIETKSKDMNFVNLKQECLDLMNNLNQILVKM